MALHRYYSSAGGAVPPPVAVLTPARRGLRRGRYLGTAVSSTNPVETANTGGAQQTGSGGPLGNPNWPCLAGFELLPLASATLPVDLGTRYDFIHDINNAARNSNQGTIAANFDPAEFNQQHTIAFDLYQEASYDVIDTVTTVRLPIRRVDLGGAGAVVVGGGTALQALTAAGDAYIQMDTTLANPWVKLWFDPTILTSSYPYSRVIRVGVRYVAWRDDSANVAPGEGYSVVGWDTTLSAIAGAEYGNWLVTDYRQQAQYVTRWLGETDLMTRGFPLVETWKKTPFTAVGLARQGATDQTCFIQFVAQDGDFSQTNVALDFAELVVEVCPERRNGVACRRVSNLWQLSGVLTYPYDATSTVSWRSPTNATGGVILTDLAGGHYVMSMREALPPSPSDRYRVISPGAMLWSNLEAVGASLRVTGVTQYRPTQAPQLTTMVSTISDGVLVAAPVELTDYNLAAVAYDAGDVATSGPFWFAANDFLTPFEVSVSSAGTRGIAALADGTTTYTRVLVTAVPDPLVSDGLTISVQQPLGVDITTPVAVTAAQVIALADIGEGWRTFEVILLAPVTPASGTVYIIASSNADPARPWRLAGAHPLGTLYGSAYTWCLALVCDLAAPAAPTVTLTVQGVAASDSCGVTHNRWLRLQWPADDDVWVYGINRSTDAGVTVSTNIALVHTSDAVAGICTFDDLACPWDVGVSYSLTAYRAADRIAVTGAYTPVHAALDSEGPVLGITDGTTSMIYAPADESGTVSMTWTDLDGVEYVQRSGADAQIPVRALEERGMALTVAVLIDAVAVCTTTGLSVAQSSFAPTPWDTIRAFARAERLDVRFPGGHTRVMSLSLSGLIARNQFGVYLAELTLTDINADFDTATIFAGA